MTILRGITWDHPRGFDPLVACAAEWRAQTGVDVQWEKRSLQAFADAPIAKLAEDYDLLVIDHPHIGLIASEKSVATLPMPQVGTQASVGASAESYVWDGKCYAYAIDGACQMAVRRQDSTAPEPVRWDQFLSDDAKQFRALTPLKPVDAFDMLLTLVASQGLAIPYSPMHLMERGAVERGLGILAALYRLGPEEALDWNPIHVLDILSEEQSDFAMSPCLFGYVNYAKSGFRAHPLTYFDLPTYAGQNRRSAILGGAGVAVSAVSDHREDAIAHAAWLASPQVQAGTYLANQGQPAATSAWDVGAQDCDLAAFFTGGRATIDAAWTRPRDVWFIGFVDLVCEIMPDFFKRAIAPSDFADQIDALFRDCSMQVAA